MLLASLTMAVSIKSSRSSMDSGGSTRGCLRRPRSKPSHPSEMRATAPTFGSAQPVEHHGCAVVGIAATEADDLDIVIEGCGDLSRYVGGALHGVDDD